MCELAASLCTLLLGFGSSAAVPVIIETQDSQVMAMGLKNAPSNSELHYDADSLTLSYQYRFGAAQFGVDVTNPFALTEHEPPGGVFLEEETLLTSELQGLDVDAAGEAAVWLHFAIGW